MDTKVFTHVLLEIKNNNNFELKRINIKKHYNHRTKSPQYNYCAVNVPGNITICCIFVLILRRNIYSAFVKYIIEIDMYLQ